MKGFKGQKGLKGIAGMAAWILLCIAAAAPGLAQAAQKILVFGDSLSAAYGIAQSSGWVSLLDARLRQGGLDYSVVNASISGETTSGGLARIRKVLAQHRPAVVILQLGANDGLRGLPVAEMRRNLSAMVDAAHQSGAKVLLVGMRMPPNYGAQYMRAFEAAFSAVAKTRRVALLPFLLEGMADQQQLFQADAIHPVAAAQPALLDNVWRELRPLLKK